MFFSSLSVLSPFNSQPSQPKRNAERITFSGQAPSNQFSILPADVFECQARPDTPPTLVKAEPTDVLERQTQPVIPSPLYNAAFNADGKIEKHHEARAVTQRRRNHPGDTYYFRHPSLHVQAAKAIQRLQESIQQPLPIVIEGDHRGKDAASQIVLLQGETGLDYPELAQRFPIIRRDMNKSDLDKGLKLHSIDKTSFQELRDLDEKKYEPVTRNLLLSQKNPEFRKALGSSQMVDITDPTLPAPVTPSPNVRMAMQILQFLSPEERPNYIRDLSKTQGPGSLLILGTNESLEDMPEVHEELKRLGYEPAPENEQFGVDNEQYIYQKARNVEVPARNPKVEALIHSDALKKNPDLAMLLSMNGLDPHHIDPEDGQTLLHTAAQCGLSDVVKELLNAGVNPKIRDTEGKTAYALAKDYKQYGTMAVLRRHQTQA